MASICRFSLKRSLETLFLKGFDLFKIQVENQWTEFHCPFECMVILGSVIGSRVPIFDFLTFDF